MAEARSSLAIIGMASPSFGSGGSGSSDKPRTSRLAESDCSGCSAVGSSANIPPSARPTVVGSTAASAWSLPSIEYDSSSRSSSSQSSSAVDGFAGAVMTGGGSSGSAGGPAS